MAFQSMLSGAECSASSNQLSQFLKHAQTDRSLQQDTMQGPTGVAQRPAFRTQPAGARASAPEMEAFLRARDPMSAPFDMQAMRSEMEALRGVRPPPAVGGAAHAWAQELQQPAPHAGGAWSEQFQSMSASAAPAPSAHAPAWQPREAAHMPMSGAFMPGLRMGPRPPMPAGLVREQAPNRFVELDDAQWQAQFDRLEAEAAADAKGKGKAAEGPAEAQAPSTAEADALDEEAQLKELREMEARLRDEVHDDNPRFEELWNALKDTSLLEKRDDLAEWERQLMEAVAEEDPVNSTHPGGGLGYGEAGLNELDGLGEDEAELRRHLNEVDERGFPVLGTYEYEAHNPFVSHASPYAEGMRLIENNGSLTDAALLFEAATQRDAANGEIELSHEERSRAWQKLGECHAMNEHETKAIQALEEALRLDGSNQGALMSLAVSCINEGYDQAANETLLRYLARSHPHLAASSEFPSLSDEHSNPWARLNYVRGLYLKAVREDAAEQRMDPDLQVGLGLLFYASSSYDQARDCFRAALAVRPDDWQLWNRLGATLANSGKPELATEAYHKALELRPTFTRAIYNLSVSCLNLGAHHEAAEHLLSALALQRTQTLPDTPDGMQTPMLAHVQESQSLWNTLRSIMVVMDQFELANQCQVGTDLDVFRRAGFEF
ncbi:Peroxisomal membrane signal receptor PTS1 [Malassezia caprae]|uniref:Peroxisomal membrane signal receptor PTS1 n=1 Tax=Malassezia caprae TaxID=1381934 RepID=A0AAF0IWQ4_9BASI|nr:Peroxisomal membrane signal receptor PTS1 [Malassezia caprae]